MNALEQLRTYSAIVADTADYHTLAKFSATDATTNPSLILKATQSTQYQQWRDQVLRAHTGKSVAEKIDALLVSFGVEILRHLKGSDARKARVSTEVDARLSFDTHATVHKARQLIALYRAAGVDTAQVLIKIASTWEGIQAARILRSEGIACNLTLLFSLAQARACADADVQLISPFVGRVSDWNAHKQKLTAAEFGDPARDQGVQLVSAIYQYYKARAIATEIMGASFRNTRQVLALSGCDLLTISPNLLEQLQQETVTVPVRLTPPQTRIARDAAMSEVEFRFALNQDEMAHDKLAEGIRLFVDAAQELEKMIESV